ncbi:MAG: hypothetical protein LBH68_03065 [Bifidobacteriaceae bacterium]|jgi:hypothetical protein|nr:hypothetical protein [Bifidobacteriaceae bacterium]
MATESIDVLGGTAGNISCMEDLDRLAERLDNAQHYIRDASRKMLACELPPDDGLPLPGQYVPPTYPPLRNNVRFLMEFELNRLIPPPPFGYSNGAIDTSGPLRNLSGQLQDLADKVRLARQNYDAAERATIQTVSGWQKARAAVISTLASGGTNGQIIAAGLTALGMIGDVLVSLAFTGHWPSWAHLLRNYHADLRGLIGPAVLGATRFLPASTEEIAAGICAKVTAQAGRGHWISTTRGPTVAGGGVDSIEALIGKIGQVAGGDRERTDISITKVTDAYGKNSWLVSIPGTESMAMGSGLSPSDNLTNLEAVRGDLNAIGLAVTMAMGDAGIKPGDPVVLAGHSQGGIVGAALSADEEFAKAYNVTAVLTAGSPTGLLKPSRQAQWLSMEHVQDVVPVTDGKPNPHAANHTTVVRDLDPSRSKNFLLDPLSAHHLPAYAETAALVDASGSQSVQSWKAAAAPIFNPEGQVETTVYTVERLKGPPYKAKHGGPG